MGLGPAKDLAHMFARKAKGYCPACGKSMAGAKFRDRLSQREAEISGFCQDCQDKTFGTPMKREYLCEFVEYEPPSDSKLTTDENPMLEKLDYAGIDMGDKDE